MTTEYLQMMFDKLDALSIKLGIAVEHIWPWFIKQQYIEAFYPLTLMIIFLIIFMYSFMKLSKMEGVKKTSEIDEMFYIVLLVLSILSAFAVFCSFIITLNEIGDVFNVEYAALKAIIHLIK